MKTVPMSNAKVRAWGRLYGYLIESKQSYHEGVMMSMAESIHGESVIDDIIKKMEDLLKEEYRKDCENREKNE